MSIEENDYEIIQFDLINGNIKYNIVMYIRIFILLDIISLK